MELCPSAGKSASSHTLSMGLERAYTVNITLKKVLPAGGGDPSNLFSVTPQKTAELGSVPKVFGRNIGGCGSKQCEGPPFSCGQRLLLLREQDRESWQLLLRNLRAMFNTSMGRWEGGGKVPCTQHPTLATH